MKALNPTLWRTCRFNPDPPQPVASIIPFPRILRGHIGSRDPHLRTHGKHPAADPEFPRIDKRPPERKVGIKIRTRQHRAVRGGGHGCAAPWRIVSSPCPWRPCAGCRFRVGWREDHTFSFKHSTVMGNPQESSNSHAALAPEATISDADISIPYTASMAPGAYRRPGPMPQNKLCS